MSGLADLTSARDAMAEFSWERAWDLVDGDRERLNIAHECLDRHPREAVAARVAHADGGVRETTFGELADSTSRFAHWLAGHDVGPGARVAVMMEPSARFHTALFGAVKRGAVGVPLYTLFGPDSVAERLTDCGATLLVVDPEFAALAAGLDVRHLVYDDDFDARLAELPTGYRPDTAATDLAVLQYTSGTTRQLPEAVRHDHRSVVTLARAALFGLGLRRGDRYFCPSSPAWGHGLWHGTVSPWLLGVACGSYAGRFSVERLVTVLRELEITNLAAASTVYRMILGSGRAGDLAGLRVASYTGEELGAAAHDRFRAETGIPVCGMYGTTETGVIIVNFPGYRDHVPRPGALGKPMPGCDVAVLDDAGEPITDGSLGEIAVRRGSSWFRTKDLGLLDTDGYFHYRGRADDVIISAGWTISPLEVERCLHSHPDVIEAGVAGVPDELRGLVVAAWVVARRDDAGFVTELREYVQQRLSRHQYPRRITLLDALPKTPNGKLDRKALRAGAAEPTSTA